MSVDVKYSVCAIIVTYNPEVHITKKLIETLINQVDKIVIVDNNSHEQSKKHMKSVAEAYNCELILLKENYGLAYAQNYALNKQITQSFSHYMLFDQDSIPADNMVEMLLKYYIKLSNSGIEVGCLGPKFIDSRNKFTYEQDKRNGEYKNVDFLIASGSLITHNAIERVGMMKEELFIYQVDREWCYRAINKGFKIFQINGALMEHTVGEDAIKIWIGKWRNISIHTPLSHYYVIRNSIYLYRLSYVPIKWKITNVFKMIFILTFYSLFTTPRLLHFKMILKGFRHGICGIYGKYES